MPTSTAVFRPIADVAALESLLTLSASEAVVVFLHDPYCPVSADAHEEMERVAGGSWVIDVSRQHDLKKEIAARTKVRHESPQVFVLKDGRATWNASHYKITKDAVEKAVGG